MAICRNEANNYFLFSLLNIKDAYGKNDIYIIFVHFMEYYALLGLNLLKQSYCKGFQAYNKYNTVQNKPSDELHTYEMNKFATKYF